MLTLDVYVSLARTEVDGGVGKLARSAAAVEEEDGDVGDDAGDPAAIPCTQRKQTARRSFRYSSICSRCAQSTAACVAAMARVRSPWGKRKRRGRAEERCRTEGHGGPLISFAAAGEQGGSGCRAAGRRGGAALSPGHGAAVSDGRRERTRKLQKPPCISFPVYE